MLLLMSSRRFMLILMPCHAAAFDYAFALFFMPLAAAADAAMSLFFMLRDAITLIHYFRYDAAPCFRAAFALRHTPCSPMPCHYLPYFAVFAAAFSLDAADTMLIDAVTMPFSYITPPCLPCLRYMLPCCLMRHSAIRHADKRHAMRDIDAATPLPPYYAAAYTNGHTTSRHRLNTC